MGNMIKCFLITFLTLHLVSLTTLAATSPKDLTLREACGVTRYRPLCMETLAQFSNASQSPYVWARGGVDVSIWNVELLNSTVVFTRDSGKLAGNAHLAVKDCVKNIAATLIRIQRSLQVLRKINSGHFRDELGVVTASLRSAIRDEDTCTGKISKAGHGEVLDGVGSMVVTATRMTNNALALNNYLAKVGMSYPLN